MKKNTITLNKNDLTTFLEYLLGHVEDCYYKECEKAINNFVNKNTLLEIGNACYIRDSYDTLYTIIDMNKTKDRILVEDPKTKDVVLVFSGEITEIIEN